MGANEYIVHKSEGWVEFRRCHCLSGYIDIWTGDCINNPNKEKKSQYALNASAQYYRLNGAGEWIKSNKLPRMWEALNIHFRKFSAQDIWDYVEGKTFVI